MSLSSINAQFPKVTKSSEGKSFTAFVTWKTKISLHVSLTGTATCTPSDALRKKMTKTFVIGATGAVVTLSPHIVLTVTGTAELSASTTATQKVGLTGRLGRSIRPISSTTFEPLTSTASANATADLWLGVDADISEAKILGVQLEAWGGIHATASDAAGRLCLTAQPEYHLGGTVYLNVWVKRWAHDFLDKTKILSSPKLDTCNSTPGANLGTTGEIANLPADAQLNETYPLPNGNFAAVYSSPDASLSWIAHRIPGAGAATRVLELPVTVNSVTSGTGSALYFTTTGFDDAEGGELLSWDPASDTAKRLHSWGFVDSSESGVRTPGGVAVGNGSIYVEATWPHGWVGSCWVVLDRLTMGGDQIARSPSSLTDCGGQDWRASATSLSAIARSSTFASIVYANPSTLEHVAEYDLDSAEVNGYSDGPNESRAIANGYVCRSMTVQYVTPAGTAYSTPMTEVLGIGDTDWCTFGGISAQPDGTTVVLGLDASGMVTSTLNPAGDVIARAVEPAPNVVDVRLAGSPSGALTVVQQETSGCEDLDGNSRQCSRVVLKSGTPGQLTTVATWGDGYGNSYANIYSLRATDKGAAIAFARVPYYCGDSCWPEGADPLEVQVVSIGASA